MKSSLKITTPLCCFFSLLVLTGCANMAGNEINSENAKTKKIDIAVYVREGDRAAADGEFDKALVQYVIALEEDASNADLYYKVGFIHQAEGRMELAERSFREAVAISPDHVPARVSMGLIALRKENYQYAKLVLEQVLEHDPDNWRALNALGVLGDLREDFVSSRAFYEKALTQSANSINVMNNLGYSFYLQGKWTEAERYFKRVVSKDPGYTHGWSNLALVYLQLGDEDMAKIAFQRVVSEHQALNNIGYFSMLRNDMKSARETLRDAARVAPSYYALAYRNLASIDATESAAYTIVPDSEPTTFQSQIDTVQPAPKQFGNSLLRENKEAAQTLEQTLFLP